MSKINFVIRLQHWMDSVPGQTFLNYAYSWGASIVILGALFKLTHLPGGNFMLFIGMGTEVVVFFLSAFDRPFDKDEIGKELPHDYETDEQIAARLGIDLDDEDDEDEDNETTDTPTESQEGIAQTPAAQAAAPSVAPAVQPVAASTQTVFVAPATVASSVQPTQSQSSETPHETAASATHATPASQTATPNAATQAAAQAAIAAATSAGAVPFDAEAKRLAEIIRMANDELLHRAQAVLSPEMEEATEQYIQKLRTLAETFDKVDEQSVKLTRDSEEMANLNRTLTAINKTYDLHFKSISQQVGTIESINEQTRKLAKQIEDLNGVYSRMIQALSVKMTGTQE